MYYINYWFKQLVNPSFFVLLVKCLIQYICFIGSWQDDEKHNFGVYTYPNKDVYTGEWENGKRNGPGVYKCAQANVTVCILLIYKNSNYNNFTHSSA